MASLGFALYASISLSMRLNLSGVLDKGTRYQIFANVKHLVPKSKFELILCKPYANKVPAKKLSFARGMT